MKTYYNDEDYVLEYKYDVLIVINNISGKHEEMPEDQGLVERHLIRKYTIPDECDPEKASSTLSWRDGILTIIVPRKIDDLEEAMEKKLKIDNSGEPSMEDEAVESQEQMQDVKVTE